MDAEETYRRLAQLMENFPALQVVGDLPPETMEWLGRAYAIIAKLGTPEDVKSFRHHMDELIGSATHIYGAERRRPGAQKIQSILTRQLYTAELDAPPGTQDAFISVGSAFDAFASVAKVLSRAKRGLLIVDPYMDQRTLIDYLPTAAKVPVRLLSDQQKVKSGLKPAVTNWNAQHLAQQPVEARLAQSPPLHDRLISVDDTEIWVLTQSLKDLAVKSPASIVRMHGDAVTLKIAGYAQIWAQAQPI